MNGELPLTSSRDALSFRRVTADTEMEHVRLPELDVEQSWKVMLDYDRQQAYIVVDDTYLETIEFTVEHVLIIMWSVHSLNHSEDHGASTGLPPSRTLMEVQSASSLTVRNNLDPRTRTPGISAPEFHLRSGFYRA